MINDLLNFVTNTFSLILLSIIWGIFFWAGYIVGIIHAGKKLKKHTSSFEEDMKKLINEIKKS